MKFSQFFAFSVLTTLVSAVPLGLEDIGTRRLQTAFQAEEDTPWIWKNATSSKGNPYRIGWRPPKTQPYISDSLGTRRDDFDEDIWWSVKSEELEWKGVSNDLAITTGLHRYKLWKSGGVVYDYTLKIHSDCCVIYKFCDKSEDCYTLSSVVYGEHTLSYNSKDPEMRRVHN